MKPLKAIKGQLVLLLMLALLRTASAQQTIPLINASFEDEPHRGGFPPKPIPGWIDCGLLLFPGESPPDIHPTTDKSWKVSQTAHHGNTYLGLVIRDNGTFEFVSQDLSTPLEAGKCYEINVHLCASLKYDSATMRSKGQIVTFARPAVFEIWGGTSYCDSRHLLARSAPVNHTEWREYTFTLSPVEEIRSIVLAAFYEQQEHHESYNGHVLIDGLSSIVEKSCHE